MNAVGINIDRYLLNCNYHLLITLLYISWIMLNTIQVVLVQGSCWEVLFVVLFLFPRVIYNYTYRTQLPFLQDQDQGPSVTKHKKTISITVCISSCWINNCTLLQGPSVAPRNSSWPKGHSQQRSTKVSLFGPLMKYLHSLSFQQAVTHLPLSSIPSLRSVSFALTPSGVNTFSHSLCEDTDKLYESSPSKPSVGYPKMWWSYRTKGYSSGHSLCPSGHFTSDLLYARSAYIWMVG